MHYHQLFTCVLLSVLLGCGGPVADYSKVDLIKGAGKVTLDDQPLTGAVVTFEDPTDDTFSYAMTDDQGNYVLQFDSEMKGVKTGKKVVRISTTRKILGLNSKPGKEEGASDGGDRKTEKVPERFNKKSELTAEVTKGSGPFNFDLKTK